MAKSLNDGQNFGQAVSPVVCKNVIQELTTLLDSCGGLSPVSTSSFAVSIEHECTVASGICPSLYRRAVRIVNEVEFDAGRDPSTPIHDALNWKFRRFGRQAQASMEAALFLNEDGSVFQAKLSNPRLGVKYESPKGTSLRAYLPPIDDVTRQAIAKRYDCHVPSAKDSFGDWLQQHPEIPIIITEGCKKTLSLLTQGYVAISLVGVNGGVLKNERVGRTKVRRLNPDLIPDLLRFAVPGRKITLAFDQDSKTETRCKVEKALNELSIYLERKSASLRVAEWHGENGRCKGVDDLIVNAGLDSWEEVYSNAIMAPAWRILRSIKRKVRREPNLNLGGEGFEVASDKIPVTGLIVMVGAKGSRKSTLIKQLIKKLDKPWLSLTSLQALARDQAAGWGGIFVNDGDRYGSRLLNQQGTPVAGGSVCWPSILGVETVEAKILILDELVSSLQFLLGSSLANKNGKRSLLEAEFIRRVKEAELVIAADADLTEEVLEYIEHIRGDRAFLVKSERKPLAWDCALLDGTRNQAIADFYQAAQTVPDGKILVLHSDTRTLVESLSERLESQGIKTLLITQNTSGGQVEQAFLSSKGAILPSLVQNGVKVILASPSVTQGFSIEKNIDLICEVRGIFSGVSIDAEGIAQSLDRVRSLAKRIVWLPLRGRATSKLSMATTSKGVLQDIETSSKASLRLVRWALHPAILETAESINYQRENLKLLAGFEARRNRGMRDLRYTVCALMENEGKRVTLEPCKSCTTQAKKLAKELKETGSQGKIERALRVTESSLLTQEEAETLGKKKPEDLTEAEKDSLEHFYINQFYRLDGLTQEDVLWDKGGKRRVQVRNLEPILIPYKATEKTAISIERNKTNPQDWDRTVLRWCILEKTGAADFIRGVWEGKITSFDVESITPIAATLQSSAKEIELAFGIRIGKLPPVQLMAWLLDWVGITRISHKHRHDGRVINRYEIDQKNLAQLKGVIERRSQSDPPPQEGMRVRGGGSLKAISESPYVKGLRHWWENSFTPEEKKAVLDEAINLGVPPNPDLWQVAS